MITFYFKLNATQLPQFCELDHRCSASDVCQDVRHALFVCPYRYYIVSEERHTGRRRGRGSREHAEKDRGECSKFDSGDRETNTGFDL